MPSSSRSSSWSTMTWLTQLQGWIDKLEMMTWTNQSAPRCSGEAMETPQQWRRSSSCGRGSRIFRRRRNAGRGGIGETDRLAAIASVLHVVVFIVLVLSTCSSCENLQSTKDDEVGEVHVVDDGGTRWRIQRTHDESNSPYSVGKLERELDSGSVSAFLRVNEDVQEKKQKKGTKRSKRAESDGDGDGDDEDKNYDGGRVSNVYRVVGLPSQAMKRSEMPFVDLKTATKAVKVMARGRREAAEAVADMAKLAAAPALSSRTDDHSRSQRGRNLESGGDGRSILSLSLRKMLSLSHSYFSGRAVEVVGSYPSNETSGVLPVSRPLSRVSLSSYSSSSSPSSSSSSSEPLAMGHEANRVNVNDICSLIGEEHGKCVLSRTSTGHLVEIFRPKYVDQAECSSFLLLPAENTWRKDVRIMLYLLGILYCFIGLITITAVFMRAMEVIVNQKRIVLRKNPVTGHLEKNVGRIWNNTVADITLLAFGTSAPQISLALIDAVKTLGQPPGGLGTGTIIGSAAFNVFPILAVCVLVPKSGSIKKIQNFGVWVVEFTWSIWAYIWLILILQVWTPGVITVTEAVLTVVQFPVLILHAYGQDKRWLSKGNRLKFCKAVMQRHPQHSASSLTPLDDADDVRNHVLPSSPDHSGHIEVEGEDCPDRRLSWSSPPHHKFCGSRRPSCQVEGMMNQQHQDVWMHCHGQRMSSFSVGMGREHADPLPSRRPSALVNHERSTNPFPAQPAESIDSGAGRQSGRQSGIHTVAFQDQQPPSEQRPPQSEQPPPQSEQRPPRASAAQDILPLPRALSFVEPLGWEDIKSLWREQFCDAMTVKGRTSGDDPVEPADPSFTDFVLHFICFFWKVLFAFIPPPEIWHGRLAFACAVGWITAMSYVLIDLANLFGCASGINPFVLAITVLATGTCLPDLIASYIATKNDTTADSAIANINASNCINVFVGLGFPWLVTSIYNSVVLNQDYPVPSGGTGFSVMVFCIAEFSAIAIMLARRHVLGGELGGPRKFAVISCIVWLLHWAFYIIMSSLKAYGAI